MINFDQFAQVDINVGTILEAQHFPEAKKPAYKLLIDFGPEIGLKRSSAQITHHYTPDILVWTQIIAVTNFPNKQIWPLMSEVLVLGVHDANGHVTLLRPEHQVENGERMC